MIVVERTQHGDFSTFVARDDAAPMWENILSWQDSPHFRFTDREMGGTYPPGTLRSVTRGIVTAA